MNICKTPGACKTQDMNRQMKIKKLTARTTTSTPPSTFPSPNRFAIDVAKLVVSSVVVLRGEASAN